MFVSIAINNFGHKNKLIQYKNYHAWIDLIDNNIELKIINYKYWQECAVKMYQSPF